MAVNIPSSWDSYNVNQWENLKQRVQSRGSPIPPEDLSNPDKSRLLQAVQGLDKMDADLTVINQTDITADYRELQRTAFLQGSPETQQAGIGIPLTGETVQIIVILLVTVLIWRS